MEKRGLRVTVLGFIICLIVLIVAYFGAKLYCLNQSNVLHTYVFSKDNIDAAHEDVLITITVSKEWDDSRTKLDKPIGAQYDGVIINKSERAFKDWVVKLEFSEELVVDSSWNGDFLVSGNEVTFVAKGLPVFVAPNSSETFGAVMYSNKVMTLESYTLEGYEEVLIKDLPFFWIWEALTIIWVIALIIHIVSYYKTIAYRRRVELDSQIILQSMSTLTSFIDAKDAYTRNHSTRVAIYSAELGRRLKMSKDEVDILYYIALMHDCGKIGIPDQVLNNTKKLSEEEYRIIQSHTEIGQRMLADFTAIPNIRDGAHYHHERFDGKGYPEGLKGTDIPICARIICVADSYDAMSSDRCYRKALSKEEILTEMINNSGKQFDPDVNCIMISMIQSAFVEEIKEKYPVL